MFEGDFMRYFHYVKKYKLLWGIFLLAAWSTVIVLFLRHQDGLSAQALANYQPERPLVSCLIMLVLFLLKSVDFLMHSGILYAANGIMFSLPYALLMNLAGIVISVTPAYLLGKMCGSPVIEILYEKYPKLRTFTQCKEGGSFMVAVLLRTVGLPIQIGSVYMGASNYSFGRFLSGSVLGLLPIMVPYTVMGESAGKPGSPAFFIAVTIEAFVVIASLVTSAVMARRRHTVSKHA